MQPIDEGMPLHPDSASHRFADMMRVLDMRAPSGRSFGLHSLRHFVATHQYDRTKDWVQVAKYMGHTSPAIAMDLYANNVVEHTQTLLADIAPTIYSAR
jgi:integrase